MVHTMLDTPLVRGEREGLAEVGGVRLDMLDKERNKGWPGLNVFKSLTCAQRSGQGTFHSSFITYS